MKLLHRFWEFLVDWAEDLAEHRKNQKYHGWY